MTELLKHEKNIMQVNAMLKSAVISSECPQLPLAAWRIVASDVEDRESSHILAEQSSYISGEENDTLRGNQRMLGEHFSFLLSLQYSC